MKMNWIRRELMDDVVEIFNSNDKLAHIIPITGPGGTGKTVFLRQLGRELGSPDGIEKHLPWVGILDLYHSDVNTNSGLEDRLMKSLQGSTHSFDRYQEERQKFKELREAGLLGEELEHHRSKMAKLFANCFNDYSRWNRPVIAFDTTERIQYELDPIQELCKIESETTTVRTWLLEQLDMWQNCIVLLCGRTDQGYLSEALRERYGERLAIRFHPFEMKGFSQAEASAYFQEAVKTDAGLSPVLEPDFQKRLLEVTEGRPIRLDLTLEIIRNGLGFDLFRDRMMTENLGAVRKDIDKMLIDHVFKVEPDSKVRTLLKYLAVARKGLNASLLAHLEQCDEIEAEEQLASIQERNFIKKHPESDFLFLHDEMFEFCDRFLLLADETQSLSQRILNWYEQEINQNHDIQKKRDLEVESLYYRLRADPLKGYHWYIQTAEFAIRAAEVGFEMRLRSEVIAFTKSTSVIDRGLLEDNPELEKEFEADSGCNWVKRFLVRGENKRAVEVANSVRARMSQSELQSRAIRLAQADLDVYHAQALIYLGELKPAEAILNDTIQCLEAELEPEEAEDEFSVWRWNLILGRAYNNLGYGHWMLTGNLNYALEKFGRARTHFKRSDLLREELANTNDNMARVYALLRKKTYAEVLVEEGLDTRRELNRDYRIGLSLVSRAIIHLEFGEAEKALANSEEAYRIFEAMEAKRGMGLALMVRAHANRELAMDRPQKLRRLEYNKYLGYLDAAITDIQRAEVIFNDLSESVRQIEAFNELGCIYRERARLEMESEPDGGFVRSISSQAIEYLKKAIENAQVKKNWVWAADSCEDLAQVYYLRKDYTNALHWLSQGEGVIPAEYKIDIDRKAKDVFTGLRVDETTEMFWAMMGKIHLLRGNLLLAQQEGGETQPLTLNELRQAIVQFALSAAYFEHYSALSIGIPRTQRAVYEKIKRLTPENLSYLKKEIGTIVHEYGIDSTGVERFMGEILGLALMDQ